MSGRRPRLHRRACRDRGPPSTRDDRGGQGRRKKSVLQGSPRHCSGRPQGRAPPGSKTRRNRHSAEQPRGAAPRGVQSRFGARRRMTWSQGQRAARRESSCTASNRSGVGALSLPNDALENQLRPRAVARRDESRIKLAARRCAAHPRGWLRHDMAARLEGVGTSLTGVDVDRDPLACANALRGDRSVAVWRPAHARAVCG